MPNKREQRHKAKTGMQVAMPQTNGLVVAEDEVELGNADEEMQCCLPSGCSLDEPVEISRAIKVICNYEQCGESGYMHPECFESFEEDILTYLRGIGRARSWSEKQRRQNLWTKKGYDLAYKCCACLCGKGHLRKDLDFKPPKSEDEPAQARVKRKKKKSNDKPAIGVGVSTGRQRRTSQSSNYSQSPPERSPLPKTPNRRNSRSNEFFGEFFSSDTLSPIDVSNFLKRVDFSVFLNVLPRHKVNPYHIKMEEDLVIQDDIRTFILSNFSARKTNVISCVLCRTQLTVFDKYPLIDGTFFLTPEEFYVGCLKVEFDGRTQFMSAVCMLCLEGNPSPIRCKVCNSKWDGSSHQIGTMYSYDILAASPCCQHRVSCKSCNKPVIDLSTCTQYFSEYSQAIKCPHCGKPDYHFVKPLSTFEIPVR